MLVQLGMLLAIRPLASELSAPNILSCEHDEEWLSYAATVHSHLERADGTPSAASHVARQPYGLPKVCAQKDVALYNWSDGIVFLNWPSSNPWDTFKESQYACDHDSPEQRDRQKCTRPSGGALCLHGVIAASACLAVMYANNADSMQDLAGSALGAARGLNYMLRSGDKMLELLDSSTWPHTVADVAAIVSTYAQALVEISPRNQHESMRLPLRDSGRPWTPETPGWRRAEKLAQDSLAWISAWRWPPLGVVSQGPDPSLVAVAGRRLVRIWAFGTHCAVMAEPISAMATLLSDEFELQVVWRGAKDYCGYLSSGDWPVIKTDEGSAVRAVYDTFHEKSQSPGKDGYSHRDSLRTPDQFERAFRKALLEEGTAFSEADLGFCSEPALACAVMYEGGKPLLGYFGVHISFMVKGAEEQLRMYRRFRDELAADARNTFAAVAPYISLQMFYHMPVEVPAVRPLSLYTLPAVYTATSPKEVLFNKRPVAFWDLSIILNAFAQKNGFDFTFVDATELYRLGRTTFSDWCSFRAALYFPYDWLQTMTFYDWVNMALPTFVPDTPLYILSRGTNAPTEWEATLWHTPSSVYPHHYSDWDDFGGRVYWWFMTDFKALPGVTAFASVPDLLETISSQQRLWKLSGQLRQAQQQRVASASLFWRSALLRALG